MEQLGIIKAIALRAPEFYKVLVNLDAYKTTAEVYQAFMTNAPIPQDLAHVQERRSAYVEITVTKVYDKLCYDPESVPNLDGIIIDLFQYMMIRMRNNMITLRAFKCESRFDENEFQSLEYVAELAYIYEHLKDPNFSVVEYFKQPRSFPTKKLPVLVSDVPMTDEKGIPIDALYRYDINDYLLYIDLVRSASPPPPAAIDEMIQKKEASCLEFVPHGRKYSSYRCVYDKSINRVLPSVFFKYQEHQFAGYLLEGKEEDGKAYVRDKSGAWKWIPKLQLEFHRIDTREYVDLEPSPFSLRYRFYKCIYSEEYNRPLPSVFFKYPYESYEKHQFAGYLLEGREENGWVAVLDKSGTWKWFPKSYLTFRRTDTNAYVDLV